MPKALTNLTACGAYGRDYAPLVLKPLLTDWDTGKDFRIVRGAYFSARDVPQLLSNGYQTITFESLSGLPVLILHMDLKPPLWELPVDRPAPPHPPTTQLKG